MVPTFFMKRIDERMNDMHTGDMNTTTRDKWQEALLAWKIGTTKSLPSDNPYRYLVSVHDEGIQHQGMQTNCPACSEPNGGVR